MLFDHLPLTFAKFKIVCEITKHSCFHDLTPQSTPVK